MTYLRSYIQYKVKLLCAACSHLCHQTKDFQGKERNTWFLSDHLHMSSNQPVLETV